MQPRAVDETLAGWMHAVQLGRATAWQLPQPTLERATHPQQGCSSLQEHMDPEHDPVEGMLGMVGWVGRGACLAWWSCWVAGVEGVPGTVSCGGSC